MKPWSEKKTRQKRIANSNNNKKVTGFELNKFALICLRQGQLLDFTNPGLGFSEIKEPRETCG